MSDDEWLPITSDTTVNGKRLIELIKRNKKNAKRTDVPVQTQKREDEADNQLGMWVHGDDK